MKQLSLRVDEELYEKIEQARGGVPRERWMRDVIKSHLRVNLLEEERNGSERRVPTPDQPD